MKPNCRLIVLAVLSLSIAHCSPANSGRIRDSIGSEIDRAQIGRHEIDIDVRRGDVILSGTVNSHEARRTVENIATNTHGVQSVTNHLMVASHYQQPQQQELAQRVWENIQTHEVLGTYKVQISADKGVVTLDGSAGSERTRLAIENIARETVGVNRVNNRMMVASDRSRK